MKPLKIYVSGINFDEYEIKPGQTVTAFITAAHPGKEKYETVQFIEMKAYERLQKNYNDLFDDYIEIRNKNEP